MQARDNVRHNTGCEESRECGDDLHRGEDDSPDSGRISKMIGEVSAGGVNSGAQVVCSEYI